MIKIIKPGNVGKAECKICGCIFTFEYEDITFSASQLDPINGVICPCCGELIDISVTPKPKKKS